MLFCFPAYKEKEMGLNHTGYPGYILIIIIDNNLFFEPVEISASRKCSYCQVIQAIYGK
jgi:hypothetical protein